MSLRRINTIGATPFTKAGKEINHKYLNMYSTGGGSDARVVLANNGSEQKVLLNQIGVGSGSDQRVGRVVNLRSLIFRWAVQAPERGAGGSIRMIVVFDKRPERNENLAFANMFIINGPNPTGINAINALPKEAHDGRYEFLLDKTVRVSGSHPPQATTAEYDDNDVVGYETDNLKSGYEILDLSAKKFFTQYTPQGTSGYEENIEYGTLHFLVWSNVGFGAEDVSFAAAPRLHAFGELRWTD